VHATSLLVLIFVLPAQLLSVLLLQLASGEVISANQLVGGGDDDDGDDDYGGGRANNAGKDTGLLWPIAFWLRQVNFGASRFEVATLMPLHWPK
jgi:hypothetical protein